MKNILLINPAEADVSKKQRKIAFPSLALQAVAGSFSNAKVKIIDEPINEIPYDGDYDLVGITVNMSCKAPHAYELAKRFKENGKKVILGGIHVSVLPDEAIRYCDSVVIGEIETLGDQIMDDLESGKLKKIYSSAYPDINLSKPVRNKSKEKWKKFYMPNLVETSRGCPNDCSFCSVTKQYGRKHRTKSIENILKEIENGNMKGEIIAFLDNNIAGSPANYENTKSFFKALIPYRIKWFGQFDTRIEGDDELIHLMAASGCKAAFIGFESLSPIGLESIGKKWNMYEKFSSLCQKLHENGIGIIGSFIFGLDSDTPNIFKETVNFAKKNKIEAALFTKLTPLPGTRLFDEMKKADRLIYKESDYPNAWRYYDGEHTVFIPKGLSIKELDKGYKWAYKEFYGSRITPPFLTIIRRCFKFPKLYIPLNLAFWRYARKL